MSTNSTVGINPRFVTEAIYDEIFLWSGVVRNAISAVALPPLPQKSTLLQSAVWFNFGVDAGKNLFPSVAALASKAALPLWLGVTAQKYYANYYNAQMADAYQMLNKPYIEFTAQLKNGIQNAERNFTATPYYRQVKAAIIHLYASHSFEDDEAQKRLVRKLIDDSQVIVTDNLKVQAIVSKNLQAIAQKLVQLHQGAQRNKILYVSEQSSTVLPQSRAPRTESCSFPRGSSGNREAPKGFVRVDPRDPNAMAALYASAYALDTSYIDYEQVVPCLDTTYAKPSEPGKLSVEERLTSSYMGTVDALARAYAKQKAELALAY